MHDANSYNNDANFLYSDVAAGGNTYEKNIMYGSEPKSMALKNNCGKLNWHINNIVHRHTCTLVHMGAWTGKMTVI